MFQIIDRDYIRSTVLQRYPEGPLFSWVDINPTELCNRTCSFCPRGVDYPNTNLHITDDVIEKIGIDLEEVDFQGMINICGNGEPLLSKNLIPLISCLSKFSIELVTNGDELVEGRIVELYDAGIDYINVSLYDGEYQLDEFHNLFERCGIPESNYTLREYWVVPDGLGNRAGSLNFGNSILNDPCYYMHYSIMIDWNGDVLFCIHSIYNKSINHGNILVNSMKDIWYGESMSKYRDLLKGNRKHSPCNKCDVNGTWFGENFKIDWGGLNE